MVNASPYIRTIIDWNGMDKDWGHAYMLVSQRPYKGKPGAGLAPGATVTLQIMQDAHDHGVDKAGRPRDNNALETLWSSWAVFSLIQATILTFPLF